MSDTRLDEAFEKIAKDEKIGIPFRTSRLYVQYGLYPKPELRGRTGYYDLKKTQLFEKAQLIKRLRDEFKFSIPDIKRAFRARENADWKDWLAQIEEFLMDFPKLERATNALTGKETKVESDRGLLARFWFGDIMRKQGMMSAEEYQSTAAMWRKFDASDIKCMLQHYGVG